MSILQTGGSPMIVAVIAKATGLIVFGWCTTLLLRRQSAVARHLVWLVVIVGVLLTPVVARIAVVQLPVLPSAPISSLSNAPSRAALDAHAPDQAAKRPRDVRPASGERGNMGDAKRSSASNTLVVRRHSPTLASLVIALWLAVALTLLGRLALGVASVRRIIRRGEVVTAADWLVDLRDAATRLRLPSVPRIILSDQVEMAFAFDAIEPLIVVPASAREWTNDRRRAVLLHELAHIRRRDLIGHAVAGVACAVYWFNPLVWGAARRLRVESELASDDLVLESGVRATDYAQHLLDLVSTLSGHAPTVALAMARPKEFEGRLVAILDQTKRRRIVGRAERGVMVAAVSFATVCIAAVAPVPRASAARRASVEPHAPASAVAQAQLPVDLGRPPARPLAIRDPRPAPLSEVAVATLLRYGTSGVINPMLTLLRVADSLGLTAAQADSIATLNRAYMVRLSVIWSPVSRFYARTPSDSETSLNPSLGRAPAESMEALIALLPDVVGLLTDEQRGRVPAAIGEYLDAEHLRAIAGGRAGGPGGVFLPDGGPFRGGGRRGGPGR